jgi:hypothetical protein
VFKRTFWFGAGIAAGASGTVWAQRKVKEQLDRTTPGHLAGKALQGGRRVTETVRLAFEDGREAAAQREVELRDRYDLSEV